MVLSLFVQLDLLSQIIYTGKYSTVSFIVINNYPSLNRSSFINDRIVFHLKIGSLPFNRMLSLIREVITSINYYICICNRTCFFSANDCTKIYNSTRVALIFATEPVFAAITGFIWADDRLSYSAISGMSPYFCWNDIC